ncbi:MAG: hypothetical protein ABL900_13965 [Burkholderiaceae bacterium]
MSIRATPIIVLLAGCAAISGQGHLLTEDARLAANVRTCCSSPADALAHKPAAAPGHQAALLWFAATTPHFDFGNGLAPFAVFALGGGAFSNRVELESLMRLRGWAYGGDGKAHYADAVAIFFDGSGRALEAPAPLERVERAAGAGTGALFQVFPVPSGAASLVVTSNPKSNGLSDANGVLNPAPPSGVAGAGALILPGSVFPLGHRLSTYGPVQVRWIP